jgi:hypothetical protein
MGKDSIDDIVRELIDNTTLALVEVTYNRSTFDDFFKTVEKALDTYQEHYWPERTGSKRERREAVEYLGTLMRNLRTYPTSHNGIIKKLKFEEELNADEANSAVELAKTYIEFVAKARELMVHGNAYKKNARNMYEALKRGEYPGKATEEERNKSRLDMVIKYYNQPLIRVVGQREGGVRILAINQYKPFVVTLNDYMKKAKDEYLERKHPGYVPPQSKGATS